MFSSIRDSLTWLHTWGGVFLGSVLFAVFWMGTLSVFDREIDRWMNPESRLEILNENFSVDFVLEEYLPPEASRWEIVYPSERDKVLRLFYVASNGYERIDINPVNYERLSYTETAAGTGFIYPFHYHLMFSQGIGKWIVAFASMVMLVLLVSGIIIHKKILIDFFTFRPRKKLTRSSLDLHNITGVMGLPFHFAITISGLILFQNYYAAPVIDRTYGGDSFSYPPPMAYNRAVGGVGESVRTPIGKSPQSLASVDSMLEQTKMLWGGLPFYVRAYNYNDVSGTVQFRRNREDAVPLNFDWISFDAATGDLLKNFSPKPLAQSWRWITGFHFIQFDHWVARWLFFVLGLTGCILIATGFIVWFETRRKRHSKEDLTSVRVVESLTITSVTGLIAATFAFFLSNRLLPDDAYWINGSRVSTEIGFFYLVWFLTLLHAFARHKTSILGWAEQCFLVALLGIFAVCANAFSTGDHILRSLADGLYDVAGMDILLILSSVAALAVSIKLYKRNYKDLSAAKNASASQSQVLGMEKNIK
tara:strand:+ start:626 stop:2227 length:1602 start_codon:yes stop_codon:yes gene_type:complete